MFLLFIVLFSIATVQNVAGQCDKCGTISGVACISENQFHYCFDKIIDRSIAQTCPGTTVCTDSIEICKTTGAVCTSSLGKCSPTKRFTCMSANTFSLCLGLSTPFGSIITCPAGTICNSANEGEFCTRFELLSSPEASTAPTAPTALTAPTLPANATQNLGPIHPTEFCRQRNQSGRFPVETNCRQYIQCYYMGGRMQGKQYTCARSTVFDATLENCVTSTSNCI